MKKTLSITTLLSVFLFTYCTQQEAEPAAAPTEPTQEEIVERGAYDVIARCIRPDKIGRLNEPRH